MARSDGEDKGKILATNRKARHLYHIVESYEAGIVLQGTEVKSIRNGGVSLSDSHAEIRRGELFLKNMHISPYPFAHNMNLDPTRPRKLGLRSTGHASGVHNLGLASTGKSFAECLAAPI